MPKFEFNKPIVKVRLKTTRKKRKQWEGIIEQELSREPWRSQILKALSRDVMNGIEVTGRLPGKKKRAEIRAQLRKFEAEFKRWKLGLRKSAPVAERFGMTEEMVRHIIHDS